MSILLVTSYLNERWESSSDIARLSVKVHFIIKLDCLTADCLVAD